MDEEFVLGARENKLSNSSSTTACSLHHISENRSLSIYLSFSRKSRSSKVVVQFYLSIIYLYVYLETTCFISQVVFVFSILRRRVDTNCFFFLSLASLTGSYINSVKRNTFPFLLSQLGQKKLCCFDFLKNVFANIASSPLSCYFLAKYFATSEPIDR